MIETRRNRLFEGIFLPYTRHIMRRQFYGVHVGGLEHVERLDRMRPVIFVCNHSSWWDGMLAFVLSKDIFHLESFAMMEEKQMRRYPFFRMIGAFSVVRESPRQAVESMRYAASVFTKPNVALWIYPQGVLLANDIRPLRVYPGVARIAAMLDGVQLVPVAHRYEFLLEQRPEAFTLVGEPWTPTKDADAGDLTVEVERRLTGVLDQLRSAVARGDLGGCTTILRGRSSVNARLDSVRRLRSDL
jgi:chlorobactene lauroyltransferase